MNIVWVSSGGREPIRHDILISEVFWPRDAKLNFFEVTMGFEIWLIFLNGISDDPRRMIFRWCCGCLI
jgi:hypothetical protein